MIANLVEKKFYTSITDFESEHCNELLLIDSMTRALAQIGNFWRLLTEEESNKEGYEGIYDFECGIIEVEGYYCAVRIDEEMTRYIGLDNYIALWDDTLHPFDKDKIYPMQELDRTKLRFRY